jgi:hypothetical protein
MVHVTRALLKKMDSMQDHTDNVWTVMKTLRKNQKGKVKNAVTKMKNSFDGLRK